MPLAAARTAGHGGQRHYLNGHSPALSRAQAQLLHPAVDLPLPPLQHAEQVRHLAAAGEIAGDLLRAEPHCLELLDLHDARHIVVVIIPPSALRRDAGGREQALFLHAQQRTAGEAAGVRRLGDLKEGFFVLFHKNAPKSTLASFMGGRVILLLYAMRRRCQARRHGIYTAPKCCAELKAIPLPSALSPVFSARGEIKIVFYRIIRYNCCVYSGEKS